MAKAVSSMRSIHSHYKPQASDKVIEAEVRWATFVSKHNLAFLSSDHAKLFKVMFPDTEIAKRFSCARTKTTAIVKVGLAPHFTKRVIDSMSTPFSLLMDESNDKTDIILVRVLDPVVGECRTWFLDMPVVNIGTADNLFQALKSSLEKHGLRAVAFMSDTTNVMKGARSGVQKLIKNEIPTLYDVGCICHLADLTVKAGLKALPVDIDQLFVDVFYYFHHSSKRKQQFVDLFCGSSWCSLFSTEPEIILKHCPTRWLSLLKCVDQYLRQYDGLKSYFLSCDELLKFVTYYLGLRIHLRSPCCCSCLSFSLPSTDSTDFSRSLPRIQPPNFTMR